MDDAPDDRMMEMTVKIVASYVANNVVEPAALADLIRSVHGAIATLSGEEPAQAPAKTQAPAVAVSKSVTPEYIICLEDGRKLKMLKRYLRTRYDMSPEDYRAKWSLPAEYPMVAPNYARLRSRHAKQIGLGKKK
jgi:predicted transcriptional regulator